MRTTIHSNYLRFVTYSFSTSHNWSTYGSSNYTLIMQQKRGIRLRTKLNLEYKQYRTVRKMNEDLQSIFIQNKIILITITSVDNNSIIIFCREQLEYLKWGTKLSFSINAIQQQTHNWVWKRLFASIFMVLDKHVFHNSQYYVNYHSQTFNVNS